MAITFAGQPLLLEDPGRELQRWLDRAMSLDDLRLFGDLFPAKYDARDLPRGSARAFVGLPTPNWSAPPRPKINTLWWPTGASRWAVGLFLVSGDQWDTISEELDSDGGAILRFSEEKVGSDAVEFQAKMYALPLRRLDHYTDSSAGSPYGLYLLPLVDVRYFWQYEQCASDISFDKDSTWDDAFTALSDALGITITADAVPEAYLMPAFVELSRPCENAALMLDAIAWSVGQRIIASLDGSVLSIDKSWSDAVHLKNISGWTSGSAASLNLPSWWEEELPFVVWAGHWDEKWENARRPATVLVVFPVYRPGDRATDGDVWTKDVDGSAYAENLNDGKVKAFHDTCRADFRDDNADPDNLTALEALATQIAADYYGHMPQSTWDVTFVGLRHWFPSGYDDWVWWHFGWQYPTPSEAFVNGAKEKDGKHEFSDYVGGAGGECGDYACFTRACSLPTNCEVSELLHQDDVPDGYWDRCTCLMKGTDGSGDSGTTCTVDNVEIIQGTSPLDDPTDMEEELEDVYNTKSWWFQDNAKTRIEWNETTDQWEIYQVEQQARFITFAVTTAFTTLDAEVAASVTDFWDGSDPDPGGADITVYNVAASTNYIFEGDSGDKGVARLDEIDGKYRIVQMECP